MKQGPHRPSIPFRVGRASSAGVRCPGCGRPIPAPLEPGEVCDTCRAASPWTVVGTGRSLNHIVITHEDIHRAEVMRAVDNKRDVTKYRIVLALILTAAGGITFLIVRALMRILGSVRTESLEKALSEYTANGRISLFLGLSILVIGILSFRALRRSVYHRAVLPLALALYFIVSGTLAAAIGTIALVSASSFGFSHTSMPMLPGFKDLSNRLDINYRATVVIFAVDKRKSFLSSSLGSGAVIERSDNTVTVLTSRHVAVPSQSTAVELKPNEFTELFVNFADGRSKPARIVWVAPPPVDLALLEIDMQNGPKPVALIDEAEELSPSNPLYFIPNPYRDGWKDIHGSVLSRQVHNTPEGRFSLIITDLPVLPGDSGGGLFNSDGELVGVITWRSTKDGAPQGISLPSNALLRYWRAK